MAQLHDVYKAYKEKAPKEWRLGQFFVNTYEVPHPWPSLFYADNHDSAIIIKDFLNHHHELKERANELRRIRSSYLP